MPASAIIPFALKLARLSRRDTLEYRQQEKIEYHFDDGQQRVTRSLASGLLATEQFQRDGHRPPVYA